ncbi:MAG: type II secretion system protein GspM [Candidatus Competibacter sp.]|nr:type II secretion system protein GspM [Candidatus Competibacter sp.]MDG4584073.1 type II secretion system protein GspM [Candidatus Competibacter sp.]
MTAVTAPGWGQRLGALALLLLVVAGILYFVVGRGLIVSYRFYEERLEQQQVRLEQFERMAASREPIQQLIASIRQDRNITAQYLPQSAPPLAAADLQQRVKAVVEAVGGTLRSTQALPPVEEGNAVKVAVNVTVSGDTESLQKILYDLESQTPLLFVDNLDVSAREIRQRLPSGRLTDYTRVQLNIQFEVSGYLRKEGG